MAVKKCAVASECHAKNVSGQPIIIKAPVLRMRIVANLKQVKSSRPPMKKIPAKAGVEQVENAPLWGKSGQYYNI